MSRRKHVCSDYSGQIVDLVSGELTADEERKLMEQLRPCSVCISELAALRSTTRAFHSALESVRPSHEYWLGYEQRLGVRIAATEEPVASRRLAVSAWPAFWNWRAVVAAAAFSVLAVAIWFNRDRAHKSAVDIQGPQVTAEVSRPAVAPQPPLAPNRRYHRRSGMTAASRKLSRPTDSSTEMLMSPAPLPILVRRHAEGVRMFLASVLKEGGLSSSNGIRARFLLSQNQLIRREAEASGDLANQQNLVRLEPVLLDVAHTGGTHGERLPEVLQQRIRDGKLLLLVLGATSGQETPQ